jgi:hypothetical protein
MVFNKYEEGILLLAPTLGKFLFGGLSACLRKHSLFPYLALCIIQFYIHKLHKIDIGGKLSYIMEISQGLQMPLTCRNNKIHIHISTYGFGISCSFHTLFKLLV